MGCYVTEWANADNVQAILALSGCYCLHRHPTSCEAPRALNRRREPQWSPTERTPEETRSPDQGLYGQWPRRDRLQTPLQLSSLPLRAPHGGRTVTPSPAAQPALGAYNTTWVWGHKTLVPQPPPPSPPFPRGRTLLTCLPKGSETPLPPTLSRALVSRSPRGGGAALSKAALPPPTQPAPDGAQAPPPRGILPEGWLAPAAAPPTRQQVWPIECAEGLAGPPLPSLRFAHAQGKALGSPLAGQGRCCYVLCVNRLRRWFCFKPLSSQPSAYLALVAC